MSNSEYDDEYGPPEVDAAGNIIQELNRPEFETTRGFAFEAPGDDYMSEVDIRLEVSAYYREILRSSLFENASPSASIVEKEIRNFVRSRLSVLLGVEKAPAEVIVKEAPSPFSPEEIEALKRLAARVLAPVKDEPKATAPRPAPKPPAVPVKQEPKAPVLVKRRGPKPAGEVAKAPPPPSQPPQRAPQTARPATPPPQKRKSSPPQGFIPFPTNTAMAHITATQAAEMIDGPAMGGLKVQRTGNP